MNATHSLNMVLTELNLIQHSSKSYLACKPQNSGKLASIYGETFSHNSPHVTETTMPSAASQYQGCSLVHKRCRVWPEFSTTDEVSATNCPAGYDACTGHINSTERNNCKNTEQ